MRTDSLFYQIFQTYPAILFELIGNPSPRTPQRARQLIQRAQAELTEAAQQQKILELVETVLIYKFPKLSRQEIEQMLGLSELKQTKVYQEALEEGLQQGIEQGIEQGRRQGRQEGELALVERLLTRRLGTIAPEWRSQIQQLSHVQIEELAEALLDFSTIEDLVAWLENHRYLQ